MNLSTRLRVVSQLVRDTFRQSVAHSICWVMLATSAVCIAVCLSVQTAGVTPLQHSDSNPDFLPRTAKNISAEKAAAHGVDIVSGELRLAFGIFSIPVTRDGQDALRYLQLILAGLVADTAGILLALTWTSAFLPTFLEPSAVAVLLAKPVSRSTLLVGKYAGVLAFVLAQAVVFVGGTWLALGVRTGVWNASYLYCIPLLLLHFAIFFSFSVVLAVCTRSTIVCVLGSLFFWAMCWGMNIGRHAIAVDATLGPETTASPTLHWLAETVYWLLPKPADLGSLLFDALGAQRFFDVIPSLQSAREQMPYFALTAVASSVAYSLVLLWAASQKFEATDY